MKLCNCHKNSYCARQKAPLLWKCINVHMRLDHGLVLIFCNEIFTLLCCRSYILCAKSRENMPNVGESHKPSFNHLNQFLFMVFFMIHRVTRWQSLFISRLFFYQHIIMIYICMKPTQWCIETKSCKIWFWMLINPQITAGYRYASVGAMEWIVFFESVIYESFVIHGMRSNTVHIAINIQTQTHREKEKKGEKRVGAWCFCNSNEFHSHIT